MEINKTSTSPGGRITVIDALRGFSLIGICLIHAMQHFGAIGTMAPQAMFPWEGTLNEIFRWFINYLVFGKFFIIFSCLFGLSFFIQMDRAAKKGLDFRKRFLWRLLLLAVIGYLHGLIVRVDILLIYAILGFVLVLMYKWPTKLLAGITLFLFLGGASLVPVVYKSLTAPAIEQVEQVTARPASRPAGPRQVPTLSETIKNNAWNGLVSKMRFQVSSGRIYQTLGLFILGLIVGRIRLFERMDEFRKRLNRWALAALVLLGLLYVARPYIPAVARGEVSFYSWMGSTTTNLINLLTAYLWVIIVIEVYRSQKVQRAVEPLVSYGRMGLTNYIVQSVAGVFIFSGFGLDWSHLGVFLSVLVCLAYTGIQIVISHYWLKGFRYGPMEWLWRTGTYMKWQPLIR
ncbi:hypothetical protein HMPREF1212_03297 [Parabacteroides sp. HGS0025]|uniref:DUF418 domain-containing protein n=1 Tax=Parabacteroides sp. HGS0025 TaxID=1078087 RepID=UPI0006171CF1|nr:DUF418 domain-containing protein [Parabacteroides sp. HGS0025]KKB50137.1 hypothetical protein HMPREF1212_03297 [Parabacteroides sp. HGS0025]